MNRTFKRKILEQIWLIDRVAICCGAGVLKALGYGNVFKQEVNVSKKLGLALSAGAARGWAHVGVLRGLEEIGVRPDIITGCSVGALVGGAYLIDALDHLEAWAHTLSPLSALRQFSFQMNSGGLINAEQVFAAFEEFDLNFDQLDRPFGVVACDLATGEEVEITSGSVLHAARASSAIPILLQAIEHHGRWLVDGAIVNPTPISLAKNLGADVVIAVDLNAVPRALDRFDVKAHSLEISQPQAESATEASYEGFSGAVMGLIEETKSNISKEIKKARSKMQARPQLFETGMAASDIVQMQIARARALSCPPDILLAPDMRAALPNAFDRADEFIETGYRSLLSHGDELKKLLT